MLRSRGGLLLCLLALPCLPSGLAEALPADGAASPRAFTGPSDYSTVGGSPGCQVDGTNGTLALVVTQSAVHEGQLTLGFVSPASGCALSRTCVFSGDLSSYTALSCPLNGMAGHAQLIPSGDKADFVATLANVLQETEHYAAQLDAVALT
jgi:hypothetical protein